MRMYILFVEALLIRPHNCGANEAESSILHFSHTENF
jgi:hypothetical protein